MVVDLVLVPRVRGQPALSFREIIGRFGSGVRNVNVIGGEPVQQRTFCVQHNFWTQLQHIHIAGISIRSYPGMASC